MLLTLRGLKMTVSQLISKLETSRDQVAEKVIAALVRKGTPAVPALIKAATQVESANIRKWSLETLGAIADRRAAGVLEKALLDERMTVRLHAVRGLARMKSARSATKIAKLLRDESGGVRVNALTALRSIGKAPAAVVAKSLDDPAWYVRLEACRACGELGIKKARLRLEKLAARDPKKAVRSAARAALDTLF